MKELNIHIETDKRTYLGIEMSVGKRSLMMNLRMIATTSHMVDG